LKLLITITEEQKKTLKKLADREGRSMSNMIIHLIKKEDTRVRKSKTDV
jgi:predicted CopG family antitoxin